MAGIPATATPTITQATLDPLSEAEAIRGLLAEAQSRLSRLIAALKLHKKQTRAVQMLLTQNLLGHTRRKREPPHQEPPS